ncbi:MAG TPA: hypothetical protein VNO26_08200 [Candidatus Limnocylindria bacterium]|nr:hypothetical protein [Candidatus Limnocylindria bacterium]
MKDGRFARRVFIGAGIYGLVGLLPLFFMERRFVELFPPALSHPEFFYGFAGVALAWQVAFLVIGSDPVRFRPLMLPAVLEKVTYGGAVVALAIQGRTALPLVGTAVIDLVLALLFAAAFLRTRASSGGLRL